MKKKHTWKLIWKPMLCAAQEQVIQRYYVKYKIVKTAKSSFSRMCDKKSETISHCERMWKFGTKGVPEKAQ